MQDYDLDELFPALCEALGVVLTIHDKTGIIHKWSHTGDLTYNQHLHEYCRYRRWVDQGYNRNCLQDCLVGVDKSTEDQVFLHHCWKGAVEVVFPVTIENRRVMTLFAGVFRLPGTNCPPQLRAEWQKLPLLTPQKEKKIKTVLQVVTDALTRKIELKLEKSRPVGRGGIIQQFILLNFDKNIGLDDIARLLSVSSSRAGHLVKELMGKTLKELLTSYRIKRGCDLLINSDFTIERIAIMTGMGSSGYFHRIFLRETGITPGQYRQQMRHN